MAQRWHGGGKRTTPLSTNLRPLTGCIATPVNAIVGSPDDPLVGEALITAVTVDEVLR